MDKQGYVGLEVAISYSKMIEMAHRKEHELSPGSGTGMTQESNREVIHDWQHVHLGKGAGLKG